ncbi:MAG: hypothetical protein KAR23_02185, partial [Candidatus Aenigmarchaeota archaeon]|nr:hypothetical protein [Candidatus Aenigmarchaeota archaeon]
SYARFKPITGSDWYYPFYVEDADLAPDYDSDSQTIGPQTTCDYIYNTSDVTGYSGNTCNLTGLSFNTSTINVTLYSGKYTITDVYDINYTWCWQEAEPQLSTPLIKSESAASWDTTTTGGWGERFYFNISVVDPQGDNVNLTLWWNETYGAARLHSYLNETLCTSCTPEQNKTLDYMGFVCNTTYSQLDTDAYFRINASDNSAGNYNKSWGPDSGYSITIEKDDVNVYNISPGWNATVNRSTALNFTIEIIDADRNTAISPSEVTSTGTPIYISKYNSNDTYHIAYIEVNSTGHVNREMVNNTDAWCKSYFSLGQNYWKGGMLSGAACFKQNITEPLPNYALPFMLYGDLLNIITLPDGT